MTSRHSDNAAANVDMFSHDERTDSLDNCSSGACVTSAAMNDNGGGETLSTNVVKRCSEVGTVSDSKNSGWKNPFGLYGDDDDNDSNAGDCGVDAQLLNPTAGVSGKEGKNCSTLNEVRFSEAHEVQISESLQVKPPSCRWDSPMRPQQDLQDTGSWKDVSAKGRETNLSCNESRDLSNDKSFFSSKSDTPVSDELKSCADRVSGTATHQLDVDENDKRKGCRDNQIRMDCSIDVMEDKTKHKRRRSSSIEPDQRDGDNEASRHSKRKDRNKDKKHKHGRENNQEDDSDMDKEEDKHNDIKHTLQPTDDLLKDGEKLVARESRGKSRDRSRERYRKRSQERSRSRDRYERVMEKDGESNDKSQGRSRGKSEDRSKENSRERLMERSRKRSRETDARSSKHGTRCKDNGDRFRERSIEISKDRSEEKERLSQRRYGSRDRSRERSRDKVDKSREGSKNRSRERSRDKRDKSWDGSKNRSRERSSDKVDRSRCKSKERSESIEKSDIRLEAKSKDQSKEHLKETSRDRPHSKSREHSIRNRRSHDRFADNSRRRSKDRSGSRSQRHSRDRSRTRSPKRSGDSSPRHRRAASPPRQRDRRRSREHKDSDGRSRDRSRSRRRSVSRERSKRSSRHSRSRSADRSRRYDGGSVRMRRPDRRSRSAENRGGTRRIREWPEPEKDAQRTREIPNGDVENKRPQLDSDGRLVSATENDPDRRREFNDRDQPWQRDRDFNRNDARSNWQGDKNGDEREHAYRQDDYRDAPFRGRGSWQGESQWRGGWGGRGRGSEDGRDCDPRWGRHFDMGDEHHRGGFMGNRGGGRGYRGGFGGHDMFDERVEHREFGDFGRGRGRYFDGRFDHHVDRRPTPDWAEIVGESISQLRHNTDQAGQNRPSELPDQLSQRIDIGRSDIERDRVAVSQKGEPTQYCDQDNENDKRRGHDDVSGDKSDKRSDDSNRPEMSLHPFDGQPPTGVRGMQPHFFSDRDGPDSRFRAPLLHTPRLEPPASFLQPPPTFDPILRLGLPPGDPPSGPPPHMVMSAFVGQPLLSVPSGEASGHQRLEVLYPRGPPPSVVQTLPPPPRGHFVRALLPPAGPIEGPRPGHPVHLEWHMIEAHELHRLPPPPSLLPPGFIQTGPPPQALIRTRPQELMSVELQPRLMALPPRLVRLEGGAVHHMVSVADGRMVQMGHLVAMPPPTSLSLPHPPNLPPPHLHAPPSAAVHLQPPPIMYKTAPLGSQQTALPPHTGNHMGAPGNLETLSQESRTVGGNIRENHRLQSVHQQQAPPNVSQLSQPPPHLTSATSYHPQFSQPPPINSHSAIISLTSEPQSRNSPSVLSSLPLDMGNSNVPLDPRSRGTVKPRVLSESDSGSPLEDEEDNEEPIPIYRHDNVADFDVNVSSKQWHLSTSGGLNTVDSPGDMQRVAHGEGHDSIDNRTLSNAANLRPLETRMQSPTSSCTSEEDERWEQMDNRHYQTSVGTMYKSSTVSSVAPITGNSTNIISDSAETNGAVATSIPVSIATAMTLTANIADSAVNQGVRGGAIAGISTGIPMSLQQLFSSAGIADALKIPPSESGKSKERNTEQSESSNPSQSQVWPPVTSNAPWQPSQNLLVPAVDGLNLVQVADLKRVLDTVRSGSTAAKPESASKAAASDKTETMRRVEDEVKLCLKPHYARASITKDDYKDIMRRAVPKICQHVKNGEIITSKIQEFVDQYVAKITKSHHHGSGKHLGGGHRTSKN